MDAVLAEIGGSVGGVAIDAARGGPGGFCLPTLSGFDASTLPVFDVLRARGASQNPAYREFVRRAGAEASGEIVTATCRELVSSEAWSASGWVNDHLRRAGLDHFLVSGKAIGGGRLEGIALFRSRGDQPFTEDDRNVLVLVRDVWRLLGSRPRPVSLAPRVEQTYRELLTGASDKEIAARLSVSPHTVRQYVKVIFRAYGVKSRAELIAHSTNGA